MTNRINSLPIGTFRNWCYGHCLPGIGRWKERTKNKRDKDNRTISHIICAIFTRLPRRNPFHPLYCSNVPGQVQAVTLPRILAWTLFNVWVVKGREAVESISLQSIFNRIEFLKFSVQGYVFYLLLTTTCVCSMVDQCGERIKVL